MLLSSSNREYPPFPLLSYFFRGCVLQMFVTSYSVTYCIYVPGKPGICFHHYCAVDEECKYSDTFWLPDRTRLFVQYTISLSSLCKLIWRHWTYKMPVTYILSSVWVRLSIFAPLSIIQYVGLYDFSWPISVVMIEKIYTYTLSYYHYQIRSMNYYQLFRVRSWTNGVRWMSFFILIYIYIYTLSFITFHIISYIVSYLIILHIIYLNIISHHIMLYHIPYHTIAYNTITYHLKYPITSYSISYHTSYHFFISKWNIIYYILYHFTSGNWEYLFKFGIF